MSQFNSHLPENRMENNSKTKDLNGVNNSLGTQRVPNHSSVDIDIRNQSTMLNTPLNSQNRSRTPSPTRPLLNSSNAPLANLETDDEVDDREVVHRPYPGVDDGFFTNGDNGGTNDRKPTAPEDNGNPDVEMVPMRPKEPEETNHEFPHTPGVAWRADGDGNSGVPDDIPDGNRPPAEVPKMNPVNPSSNPDFPFRPWGWDLEVGSTLPTGETIPDLNVYQHKKTLAQGMMDLALFSANANQLRYVLETFRTHPYYYPSVIFISISLMLQVCVGAGLIWNATYNVKDQRALCRANRINNFTIIGVFLVTVINVFISAFGVAPAPS